MKIYVFSNYTGLVERTFTPDYKTEVEIIGSIKTGTLSIGSKNYEIKGGKAYIPHSDLIGHEHGVSITAKEGGRVKHWICGKITRTLSGAYSPGDIDARGALIAAYTAIDELRAVVGSQAAEIKKLSARATKKLM